MTYLEGDPFLKEMVKMMTKFKSIRKKPEILKLRYNLQDIHSDAQARERKFTIFIQTIMHTCLSPP